MDIRSANSGLSAPAAKGVSAPRRLDVTISDQGVAPAAPVAVKVAAVAEPQSLLSVEESNALRQAFGSLNGGDEIGAGYNGRGQDASAAKGGPGGLVDLIG